MSSTNVIHYEIGRLLFCEHLMNFYDIGMIELEHSLDYRILLIVVRDRPLSIENFHSVFFLCLSVKTFEHLSMGSSPNMFQIQVLVDLHKVLASVLAPRAVSVGLRFLLAFATCSRSCLKIGRPCHRSPRTTIRTSHTHAWIIPILYLLDILYLSKLLDSLSLVQKHWVLWYPF